MCRMTVFRDRVVAEDGHVIIFILYYLFEEEQTYNQFIETVRCCLDITEDRSVDYAFGNLHFSPCVTPCSPAW